MNYYIYSKKEDLTEGMFGQGLIWLLEILNHLELKHKISDKSKIAFNVNSLPYNNIIPRFIVPKKTYQAYELDDAVKINIKDYKFSNEIDFEFNPMSYFIAHKIWNKYFEFSKDVTDEIPIFDGLKTLGIHYRGTDKNTDLSQANSITHDEVFVIIEDFLKNHDNIVNIYCCSDEQKFIDNIKNRFNKYNIIEYNQLRSHEGTSAFFRESNNVDKTVQNEMTIAAIVDMLALSRCHTVLKTSSALSAFSKIMNNQLNLYAISAMKQRWFPTGVVLGYHSTSREVNNILNRTMYEHAL